MNKSKHLVQQMESDPEFAAGLGVTKEKAKEFVTSLEAQVKAALPPRVRTQQFEQEIDKHIKLDERENRNDVYTDKQLANCQGVKADSAQTREDAN